MFISNAERSSCLEGFSDFDYAADLDKRRSLTGYAFMVGGNLVSWKSNLQHIVMFSTTEIEYVALTKAIKEAIWIQGISLELGMREQVPKVFCNSQSAFHLSKNSVFHERTKRIDIRLHFVIDIIVNEQLIKVKKISTNVNPADMLTKAIPAAKFEQALLLLNVLPT